MNTKKAKPARSPQGKRCFCYGGPNTYDGAPAGAQMIELRQHGRDNFTVRYGLEVHDRLSYADAATQLGCAIMHMLACDYALDNRMPGDQ